MSRLGINTGSNPNDGQGDPLRIAMGKINSNFTEIYDTLGDGNDVISYASTAGISTLSRNLTGSPRINVSGILNTGITTTEHLEVRNITSTGVVTATQFVGDGSQLSNIVAEWDGIDVLDENVRKGVAREINFGNGIFCSGPDNVGRVTVAVTTSVIAGLGTGISPVEVRNQNVIIGQYAKLNFGANLFAYVDPAVGIVTITLPPAGLNISGVVTATKFVGNGSELTGVITSLSGVSTFSGDYNDLANKPTIPSIVGLASEGYVDAAVSGVSTFSGDYNDLTNKPTIPVNLTDLSDVNAGAPSTGQILKWSGSEWQASADLTASGAGIGLSDLSVTINSPGISSLTYNNTTGVFQFTPTDLSSYVTSSGSVSYASSSGISTVSQGLTGTPSISVNEVGISSYLTVTGISTFLNNVHIEDSKVLIIGDNDELQLFHSGVDSYIDNSSAGNLIIRDGGTGIQLRRSGGGPSAGLMAAFNNDAGVELYYDSVLKLQTFQDGVAINDSVGIGTTAGNPPYRLTVSGIGATITSGLENAIADLTSSVDGYGQVNIRNSLSAPNASGDLVITADTGTDTSNYIDLGINNTGFSTSSWTINGVLDGYLYTSDSNLSIGVAATGKYLSLFAGGTLAENEKVRVTETGVGIGSTQPDATLVVNAPSGYTGNVLDVQVDGSSRVKINSNTSPTITFPGEAKISSSIFKLDINYLDFIKSGSYIYLQDNGYVRFGGNTQLGNDNQVANTLSQRNGTNAQTFRVYNTYTSSTNFERANVGWTTNTFIVGTEKGSAGGTARQLELQTDGTTRVAITTTGLVGIGSTQPTSMFAVGGDVSVSGVITATSFSGSGVNLTGVVTSLVGYATEGYVDAAVSTVSVVGSGGTWAVNASGIHTSKNVGIGTELSSSALWVEGDGYFSGIVTATRFESTSAGTPTIDSPNNLNINAVTVAISTDLTVGGDAYVGIDTSSGLILTSPNGTQYRLVVDNSGNLSTVLVP